MRSVNLASRRKPRLLVPYGRLGAIGSTMVERQGRGPGQGRIHRRLGRRCSGTSLPFVKTDGGRARVRPLDGKESEVFDERRRELVPRELVKSFGALPWKTDGSMATQRRTTSDSLRARAPRGQRVRYLRRIVVGQPPDDDACAVTVEAEEAVGSVVVVSGARHAATSRWGTGGEIRRRCGSIRRQLGASRYGRDRLDGPGSGLGAWPVAL